MPATFSQVQDGLQARLATITGLRAYGYVPSDVRPPAAIVAPEPGEFLTFDTTMDRGSDDLRFVITLLISRADQQLAQDALDPYLASTGGSSVYAAIAGGATLGGIVSYAVVTGARNYGIHEYAGVGYVGVEFTIQVAA